MISKTATHTIGALVALARLPKDQCAGAVEVAGRIGAPPNYLGKLLKNLAEAGLLESRKGRGGGFRLARDPAKISLFEVVDPVDRLGRWKGCLLGRSRCLDSKPCPVHKRWGPVRDTYLNFLKETTIGDLATNR